RSACRTTASLSAACSSRRCACWPAQALRGRGSISTSSGPCPSARPTAPGSPVSRARSSRGCSNVDPRRAPSRRPGSVPFQHLAKQRPQGRLLAVGQVRAEAFVERGAKCRVGPLQDSPAARRQRDLDNPTVVAWRGSRDQSIVLETVGEARCPARAGDQLGRDLGHLQGALAVNLEPEEDLVLGHRDAGGLVHPSVQHSVHDTVGLLKVEPGCDLNPCCVYSCHSNYCKEKHRAMEVKLEESLEVLADRLRDRNFEV